MQEFLSKNRDWLIELTGWLTILSMFLFFAQDLLDMFGSGDTGYKLASIASALLIVVKEMEALMGTLIRDVPNTITEAKQRLAIDFEPKRLVSQRQLFNRLGLATAILSMPDIYEFMGGTPNIEWSWAVVGSVAVFAVLVVGSFLLFSKK